MPFQLQLRDQSAAHFGVVAEEASHVDSEVEEGTRAPLAAVYELERLERGQIWSRPAVRRLSPTEAFLTLLPNSFHFEPQTSDELRRMIADYLELVARVPFFCLRVPSGLEELEELLDEVERTIADAAP